MNELTEYERKTLTIVREHGPCRYMSGIGHLLFKDEKEGRKAHPSQQGLALAAGRFVSRLEKRGLVAHSAEGRYITGKGRDVLALLESVPPIEKAPGPC